MHKTVCILLGLLAVACSPKNEKIPPVPSMERTENKVIVYQLMTRLFGNTLSVNATYGTIEENGVGKFNDINDKALQSLKALGITHVWYTGVIEHATLTDYATHGIPADDADVVKGRAGSPYSIKDYYDIAPDLATNVPSRMQEFEALVKRTHNNGLKVIIDFVPNHVARSYRSDARPAGVADFGANDDTSVAFAPNNNFYYLPGESFMPPQGYNPLGEQSVPSKDGKFQEIPAKASGNNVFKAQPAINDWFEAAKLNYGVDYQNQKNHFDPVPDTWIKMKDILVYWAQKGVDGFRCDVAEMVPVEFWNWAIPHVKAVNPEIIFVAEIYNPSAYKTYIDTGRFDFLYEKVMLYDTLRQLMGGNRKTTDIAVIQEKLNGIHENLLHFMENHDEQRIASPQFAGNAWKGVPAMVVSALIDRGSVMIYFGQEVGEPAAGDPGFQNIESKGVTTKMDYWGVPEHQKWMNAGNFDGGLLSEEQKRLRQFYATVLSIAQKNPAVVSGAYADITASNVQQKNFDDDVHAFLRWSDETKLLIVTNFSGKAKKIKLVIPAAVAREVGLKDSFGANDILWGEQGIEFTNFSTEVEIGGFGAFVFNVQ